MTGLERDLAGALDRLVPPPLSSDFAARVTAAVAERRAPVLDLPARPGLRSPARHWARRGRIGLAVAVTGLVGAAAAATGLMGERVRNLPVISFVSTEIVGRPVATPAPKPVLARRAAPPAEPVASAAPVTQPETVAAKPLPARAMKRLERVNARREARGLPPVSPETSAAVREKWQARPKADRQAIRQTLRERRAARREGDAAPRLSPEQRARLKEWRALRQGQSAPLDRAE